MTVPYMTGGLTIIQDRPLSEVASQLGMAFGCAFKADDQGIYEEYPAFYVDIGGLRFALLGIPDPQYDLGDEATTDYGLQVHPERGIDFGSETSPMDISDFLAAVIRSKTNLTIEV